MLHMEQKSLGNDFEIIGCLITKEGHIRELARNTELNHMAVKRIVDSLLEENIIDFRISGKNKIFFLKNNLESRNKILEYEFRKQTLIINKYPVLRPIFEKIIINKNVELALLFGSYAKEKPHKDSDIDIYLETKSTSLKRDVEAINSRISVKISNFDNGSLLIKEIINNHIIIKGFEKYYEKTKN